MKNTFTPNIPKVCDDGTARSNCVESHASAQLFARNLDPANLNGTARSTEKNAAQLHVENLVAASPQTIGQQLQESWKNGSVPHPAQAMGGSMKK